jgi:hypothetical protein
MQALTFNPVANITKLFSLPFAPTSYTSLLPLPFSRQTTGTHPQRHLHHLGRVGNLHIADRPDNEGI